MVDLWTLGGLSWRELLKRTAKESWQDEVFGLAARLAFYHFLALFPALLLASAILVHVSRTGPDLLETLRTSLGIIFPARASGEVTSFLATTGPGTAHRTIWFALFGSLWAAFNGTWAVISGLNSAYEVEERRSWVQLVLTAAGLTFALASLAFVSLLLLFYGRRLAEAVLHHAGVADGGPWLVHVVQWPVLAALLLIAFAVLYRFGPSLDDRELRWSTPGALIALVLWLLASGLFHAYITYQASKYDQVYGSAGAIAILLLWFYFTGAAILIGGEANSEIENAATQHGHPDGERPGEHRQGGLAPRRA